VSRVQSIERAFAVLGALTDGPAGVTDVAERIDLPKSTVARLLGSLVREGAVEQVPGDTKYRIGSRLVTLAASVLPVRSLVALAHPTLVELAEELGEAAGLSIPDGFDVHYVDQVDTGRQVQVRDWTGTRVPMHAVSSGLVFLASVPRSTLDACLSRRLERFTSRTVTAPAEIRRRLSTIGDHGFAWVHEEFAEGLNSVAAPVRDRNDAVIAAVHVHGPSYRFPGSKAEDEGRIGATVVAAARRISGRARHP
jgi:DNA-binding IclR family transcriptional regulator